MSTPNVFLAYTPRGAGLRCALAYLSTERDVYGWFTGPCMDGSFDPSYFLLEEFYTLKPTRYEAVAQAALHSPWSLDEARRHELAAMQAAFEHEWLLYDSDPRAPGERQRYREAELAAGEVMVRFDRLASFSKLQPTWTFYSQRFEHAVRASLQRRWPLEYGAEEAYASATD